MFGTSEGREQAAHHQAAWILARSHAISNENFSGRRKISKIFEPNSHAISRTTACRRSAQMLGTSEGREQAAYHQPAWISARSHAIPNENFCSRRKISKISIGIISAQNRTQSHAPQHADALHRCCRPARVVRKLCNTCRHRFLRDLTRFRTKIFAAAEKLIFFENFRSEIARNLTRRSMLTLGLDVGDLRGS